MTSISINSDLPAAAEIAAWWRQQVPDKVSLVFYDAAYNNDVRVEPGNKGFQLEATYLGVSNRCIRQYCAEVSCRRCHSSFLSRYFLTIPYKISYSD